MPPSPVSSWQRMRLVVPFGFYGCGNIGDEATLHGFARLLARHGTRATVSVGSRNPAHTARTEPMFRYFHPRGRDPRRWWAKFRGNAHAVIGGTPIMDVLGGWPLSELTPLVRATDRWKVPFGFVGVGVENLREDNSRRIVADEIAPRTCHWSVRSDRDRQRLESYGVKAETITVAADMAWLIEAVAPDRGREQLRRWNVATDRPLVGVNLVNENSVLDRHPAIRDAIAAGLDRLVDELDARVLFLANEVRDEDVFDRAAALKVIARMKRADRTAVPPNEYFSPGEMMSIVACCALTVSMRYHFCLFSALQGVPFVAIQRSDKVADLCWDLEWPAAVVPPDFTAEQLAAHGATCVRTAAQLRLQLQQSVERMRLRAAANHAAVAALQASLGTPS